MSKEIKLMSVILVLWIVILVCLKGVCFVDLGIREERGKCELIILVGRKIRKDILVGVVRYYSLGKDIETEEFGTSSLLYLGLEFV